MKIEKISKLSMFLVLFFTLMGISVLHPAVVKADDSSDAVIEADDSGDPVVAADDSNDVVVAAPAVVADPGDGMNYCGSDQNCGGDEDDDDIFWMGVDGIRGWGLSDDPNNQGGFYDKNLDLDVVAGIVIPPIQVSPDWTGDMDADMVITPTPQWQLALVDSQGANNDFVYGPY